MAAKMAESGRAEGKDVLDDSDLSDDPIVSALQTLRVTIDDIQYNNQNHGTDKIQSLVDANTAKTGITSSQASAITANTAKTGTTSTERSRIAANHAKVSYDKNLTTTESIDVKMTVTESRGAYALVFTMKHGKNTKTATIALR